MIANLLGVIVKLWQLAGEYLTVILDGNEDQIFTIGYQSILASDFSKTLTVYDRWEQGNEMMYSVCIRDEDEVVESLFYNNITGKEVLELIMTGELGNEEY